MNEVILKGIIKDIQHSHTIDKVDFDKAKLLCRREDGREDIVNLRFKSFANIYSDNDEIQIKGNLRSYSYKVEDDKNKVIIYTYTYFEEPDEADKDFENKVFIDGRICKMNPLRKTLNGKYNVHFIIANNLISNENGKRLNSYIPCIAWGKLAKEISELSVNTKINIEGQIHSREHTKKHPDGEVEIRVAHELIVNGFEVLE